MPSSAIEGSLQRLAMIEPLISTFFSFTGVNQVVSALPANPVDGQEINDTADGTNGVIWRLKYRAASASAYKGEFIGGAPLVNAVTTGETTTSTTYAAVATAGPSVTVPLAGDYDVKIGCRHSNTGANINNMSYDIGGTAAVDADAIKSSIGSTTQALYFSSQRQRVKTGLTANTALVSKYKTAGTSAFSDRLISAVPVRVG